MRFFGYTFLLLLIATGSVHAKDRLTTVVMQLDYIYNVQFAGHFVALDEGFYRAAGLKVITNGFDNDKVNPVDAVTDLTYAFGSTSTDNLLVKIADGAPVKIIGTMFQEFPSGWIYLKSPGVSSLKDLADKPIGVHNINLPMDRMLLTRAGLDYDELDLVILPEIPHDPMRLVGGEVALMPGYVVEEYLSIQKLTGGNAEIVMAKELGYPGYSQMVFTSDRMLAERPELVDAFMGALKQGWTAALDDKDAAVATVMAMSSESLDAAQQRASLDVIEPLVRPDGVVMEPVDPARIAAAMGFLVEMGTLDEALPVEAVLAK